MRQSLSRAALIGFGFALGAGSALVAAVEPPTEHMGLGVTLLGQVPAASFEQQTGLSGQAMRLREITIEPGGQIARHDHATRPGVVKVTEGEVVEGRPGGETTFSANDPEIVIEDIEADHWFFNRTDAQATLLVCDLGPEG